MWQQSALCSLRSALVVQTPTRKALIGRSPPRRPMAWKPVLASWPQKRRNLLFGPIALGVFLVVFLAIGFPTSDPFVAGLVALPAAIAGAWALLGWPVVARKDGK